MRQMKPSEVTGSCCTAAGWAWCVKTCEVWFLMSSGTAGPPSSVSVFVPQCVSVCMLVCTHICSSTQPSDELWQSKMSIRWHIASPSLFTDSLGYDYPLQQGLNQEQHHTWEKCCCGLVCGKCSANTAFHNVKKTWQSIISICFFLGNEVVIK